MLRNQKCVCMWMRLQWREKDLLVFVLSECGNITNLILCVSDFWSDRTPLHEAAFQGRLLHLRGLIAQVTLNLDLYGEYLVYNPKTSWKEVKRKSSDLSLQGFHVDTVTMDGVTPLHEACLGGRYACAKFLLDNGANVRRISLIFLSSKTPTSFILLILFELDAWRRL